MSGPRGHDGDDHDHPSGRAGAGDREPAERQGPHGPGHGEPAHPHEPHGPSHAEHGPHGAGHAAPAHPHEPHGPSHAGHGHAHGPDDPAHPHNAPLSDVQLRVRALESLLTEKGLVDPAALDELIDTYETRVGPRNGARVVARAWVDPEFRRRLLADATAVLAELGYIGRQGEDMVVVENTPSVHNLVVCTLCSCYPWPVLGLPPVWYKSAPYRSRAVIDPRGVLRELGVDLPEPVEVRVWDSTAELRYLVLPERPPGTEGMSEEELAALVTRDAMIGVARVKAPAAGATAPGPA